MAHFKKPKLTNQRLEQYAQYVAANPLNNKGHWHDLYPEAKKIHVDLGCGKGLWTTRAASSMSEDLFIGFDREPMCVSMGAEKAGKQELRNAFFALDSAQYVHNNFAEGEIDVLHINFPTPYPKKKEAHNRIVEGTWLANYRECLGETGVIQLKTDSQPLFDFALEQLNHTGYQIIWQTRDLHANQPQKEEWLGALANITSAYEEKLIQRGAVVYALCAKVGPLPENWEPKEPVSLVDYLPEDLESITYIPYGMEGTVINMRNRKRNAQERAARHEKRQASLEQES
ncbi:MAG: tRNA (guanosine(46)-N7)-methyltransferase TrmB [Anaerotardibacter sp.]